MKKKWELLKEAYDKYHKGIKITWGTPLELDGNYMFLNNNTIVDSKGTWVYNGDMNYPWAEIIPEKQPSILDGKVAIQVNNEREFKLLMEHYESKGWKWCDGDDVLTYANYAITTIVYPALIEYNDSFGFNTNKDNYDKIIPFADFAKEVGITPPVFIMKSEDGVDLYEGDEQFVANKDEEDKWFLLKHGRTIMVGDEKSTWLRVFSTIESAEKWIEEQNKPKHATVKLYRHKEYKSAEVTNNKITIRDGNDIYYLKASDIEDMYHALKSL